MSVVEKAVPRRLFGVGAGVVAVVIVVIAGVAMVDDASIPAEPAAVTAPSTRLPAPTATIPPVTTPFPTIAPMSRVEPIDVGFDPGATYRIYLHRANSPMSVHVFAYIDMASGELRFVDDEDRVGVVAARFGDTLVLRSQERVGFVDRDFARDFVGLDVGEEYVGGWRGNAIIAEYFPERTTFHVYDRSGREVRSVALVGRRPDMVAGVVRDSVVVERGGRVITLGLTDSTVRQLAVGHLVGVGGDRIFYTSCTLQGLCSLHESTLDGTVRTNPVGPYAQPGSDRIDAHVAPDGSGVILSEPRAGAQVVLAGGTRFDLSAEGGSRAYAWAPTGRLFVIDGLGPNRTLDVVDYRIGRVTTIALPTDVSRELYSVAVW